MPLRHDEVERMLDDLQDALPRMSQRYETPEAFWPIFSGSVDVILEGCAPADVDYAKARVERMRESVVRGGMKPEADPIPKPGEAS